MTSAVQRETLRKLSLPIDRTSPGGFEGMGLTLYDVQDLVLSMGMEIATLQIEVNRWKAMK